MPPAPFNANAFLYLVKGITVPGTAEQVDAYAIPDGLDVTLTARRSNSQNIYLGDTAANAIGTNRKVLVPGASTVLSIDDTNRLWFDADSAADRLEITVQRDA